MPDKTGSKQLVLSAIITDIFRQIRDRSAMSEEAVSSFDEKVIAPLGEKSISERGLRIAAIEMQLTFGVDPQEIAARLPKVTEVISASYFRTEVMRHTAMREMGTDEISAQDWKISRTLGRTVVRGLNKAIAALHYTSEAELANRDALTPEIHEQTKEPTGRRRGYRPSEIVIDTALGADLPTIIGATHGTCPECACTFVDHMSKVPAENRGMAIVQSMRLESRYPTNGCGGGLAALLGLVAEAYQ